MISIIIATYNAEKFIDLTLDSLQNQKNKKFEVIIVDAVSKDNTLKIVNKYPNLVKKIISEYDSGIYDAWNKGIKLAKYNWIMFLGAGDTLFTNAIEIYLTHINKFDDSFDYISSKIYRVDNNENILSIIGKEWKWKEFCKVMTVAHVGSLHNKKLFTDIGYFNTHYLICADYDLLIRKKDKLKSYFINEFIGKMLVGGISFSKKALVETAKIKFQHKSSSPFSIITIFILQFIYLKTFFLRKNNV